MSRKSVLNPIHRRLRSYYRRRARNFNKAFAVGFNKSGTSSMHRLFEEFGFRSFHGPDWRNSENVNFLRKYDCFGDGIPTDISKLDSNFPNSLFILQVRDLHSWLLSRLAHIEREKSRGTYKLDKHWNTTVESIREWILLRNRHHFFVLSYFCRRPQDLLVVNFIRDNEAHSKIADFLGIKSNITKPKQNVNIRSVNCDHVELIKSAQTGLSIPEAEMRADLFTLSLMGMSFSSLYPSDSEFLIQPMSSALKANPKST